MSYNTLAVPQYEVLHRNYFLEKRNGFFIECGAGTTGNVCVFFENKMGWSGLNIEASKYAFAELEKCRPHSKNLNLGLSNINGAKMFLDIISAPGGGHGNGAFQHTPAHKSILDSYGCKYERYPVKTLTFKSLVDQHVEKYTDSIDLMVLDVEGHELEALQYLPRVDEKYHPKVLCVEYPIVGLAELIIQLSDLGNYKYDFVSVNNAFFHKASFSEFERDDWYGATEVMSDI